MNGGDITSPIEPIYLRKITLHHISMKLKTPFSTSFGTIVDRECVVVEMRDEDGLIGWGESVAFTVPWYTEETLKTSLHVMGDWLIPLLFQKPIEHPTGLIERFLPIRRNRMAKAALEGAVWDLFSRRIDVPLATAIGGIKRAIEVGVAVGIMPMEQLLRQIDTYLSEGYRRIKVKIKPGVDYGVLKEIRRLFPEIKLMADANSAYTLKDVPFLQSLDEFDLMMIEQPLGADDIMDHAVLQSVIKTPVCLDESVHSYDDARLAIRLGSCRVINIKLGRVGGFAAARRIHDLCSEHGIAVWCGGMLDTGVARAHNIALASLEHFSLPGDISGSARYWERDIIQPEVTVRNGMIEVQKVPGIGYDVDRTELERVTLSRVHFQCPS